MIERVIPVAVERRSKPPYDSRLFFCKGEDDPGDSVGGDTVRPVFSRVVKASGPQPSADQTAYKREACRRTARV